MKVDVKIKMLDSGATMPTYGSAFSAGAASCAGAMGATGALAGSGISSNAEI